MNKKATLVLIKHKRRPKLGEIVELGLNIFIAHEKVVTRGQLDYIIIIPIIICDDETKRNKLVYNKKLNTTYYANGTHLDSDKVVLVNTPQIPDNIIQAIVNGDLKDGDKVLVSIMNDGNPKIHVGIKEAIVTIPEKENTSPILYTEEEVKDMTVSNKDKIALLEFLGWSKYTKSPKIRGGRIVDYVTVYRDMDKFNPLDISILIKALDIIEEDSSIVQIEYRNERIQPYSCFFINKEGKNNHVNGLGYTREEAILKAVLEYIKITK